jgi:hypothetical protein
MTTVIERRGASRRQFLGDLALLVGGATLIGAIPQAAAAKVGPGDVGYQPRPHGAAKCATCTQWQGPDVCKVVSGKISPEGWCSIYVKK